MRKSRSDPVENHYPASAGQPMVGKVHGVKFIRGGLARPSHRTDIFYRNVSEDFFSRLHLPGYVVRYEGDKKPGVRQRLGLSIGAADKQRERGGQHG